MLAQEEHVPEQLPGLGVCHLGRSSSLWTKPSAVENGLWVAWGTEAWKSTGLVGIIASPVNSAFYLSEHFYVIPSEENRTLKKEKELQQVGG